MRSKYMHIRHACVKYVEFVCCEFENQKESASQVADACLKRLEHEILNPIILSISIQVFFNSKILFSYPEEFMKHSNLSRLGSSILANTIRGTY